MLTRHPLLAAHDRLLRLELADTHDLLDEDSRAGGGGGGRLRGAERRQQLLREALAQLLGRGFVLLGRLYRWVGERVSGWAAVAVLSRVYPAPTGLTPQTPIGTPHARTALSQTNTHTHTHTYTHTHTRTRARTPSAPRFLMFKDDSLWCLAVRSARPSDQAAWAPVTNPFRVRAVPRACRLAQVHPAPHRTRKPSCSHLTLVHCCLSVERCGLH